MERQLSGRNTTSRKLRGLQRQSEKVSGGGSGGGVERGGDRGTEVPRWPEWSESYKSRTSPVPRCSTYSNSEDGWWGVEG